MKDRLIKLLIKLGVSGYTIVPVQGAGSHGQRTGDMAGYNTNRPLARINAGGQHPRSTHGLRP